MSDKMYFFENFDRTEIFTSLYFAFYLSLNRIVKGLVKSEANINKMNEVSLFLNVLYTVAYSEKKSIVRYLCENEAVVNMIKKKLKTALQAAA